MAYSGALGVYFRDRTGMAGYGLALRLRAHLRRTDGARRDYLWFSHMKDISNVGGGIGISINSRMTCNSGNNWPPHVPQRTTFVTVVL